MRSAQHCSLTASCVCALTLWWNHLTKQKTNTSLFSKTAVPESLKFVSGIKESSSAGTLGASLVLQKAFLTGAPKSLAV